ncbi:hypothetical protein [Skermania piniformis]|uniref:Twin-arginine translocation signal domain-containing protein n=1 Tax=Skermania pinensis TaxID=39122 RepID=A0ABX8SED1_9ACTN|nr:hypothetical protein [Skermania piniformis]QXQ14790.1 hypothetical protein KV203_05235 [Skermania piniformis]
MTDEPTHATDAPVRRMRLGRRRFIGGALAGAGAGALVAAPVSAVVQPAPAGAAVVGNRTFVPARDFQWGTVQDDLTWSTQDFGKAEVTNRAEFSAPAAASLVAIDIVWTKTGPDSGTIRWAGGLSWIEGDQAVDGTDAGTPWQVVSAEAPPTLRVPVTTRLGEFAINTTSPCWALTFTRQGTSAEDTYPGSVQVLGAVATVVAAAPLA